MNEGRSVNFRGQFRAQLGTTLIGLMIGMLVSTVAVLASLSLYKTLVSVATEAKIDSLHDGQLASTLLIIQLRVQNAGFGLSASTPNIGILDQNGEKRLFWRYKVDGITSCEGLRRYERVDGDRRFLAFDYIKATAATCSDSAALNSMTWQFDSTISVFPRNEIAIVDFSLGQQSCSPYGLNTAGNYYVLTLSGKTAANIEGALIGGAPLDDTVLKLCLPNIQSV
jgi:hypothetical protein